MTDLKPGDAAPRFVLACAGNETVALEDLAGKSVILYFYPKADTTGCTAEALAFTALKAQFDAAGAVVIGVSPDSPVRQEKFARKHDLQIILASDEDHQVAEAYGVWKEKSMYGRKFMGVERSTFLIDPDGRLRRIWPKVKVAGHAEEVLQALAD